MTRSTRSGRGGRAVAGLLVLFTATVGPAADMPAGPSPQLLLGDAYPVEVSVSFHAALLHWLDRLTHSGGSGMTAGKTVEAHRQAYRKVLGEPTGEALRRLERFRAARIAFASETHDRQDALTVAFFEAQTLEQALARAGPLLGSQHRPAFEEAVHYFAEPYRRIWRDGEIPNGFLERSLADYRRRRIARFLVDLAAFFEVPPGADPPPCVVLAPVRNGYGTHAQAIDRFLLIEVRYGEDLLDQIAPIVHENAHFLYFKVGAARLEALREVAIGIGREGERAWDLLTEALPTAIAQGVADQRFAPQRWSAQHRWYHLPEIDAYAKRIYPIVREALTTGTVFDESLVATLVAAY